MGLILGPKTGPSIHHLSLGIKHPPTIIVTNRLTNTLNFILDFRRKIESNQQQEEEER